MRYKRIKMFLGRLQGKSFIEYGEVDLLDRPVHVCTQCGCHFVGPKCLSKRHEERIELWRRVIKK